MTDEITRLQARVKVLEDALRIAQVHVANNAQGWSVGRGASRDDLAIVDAALASSQPADPVSNAGCRQPVKVRPLEWRNSYGALRAETLFGDYKIAGQILRLLSGSEEVHDDTEAAKAAAQADYEARILSALEDAPRVNETPKREHDGADVLTALPAPVAPSLRITGPNSDGEYWLHINAGGLAGGFNLGGERGPICKQLLDAASETGAKE